jgi:hypothetical protein
VSVISANFKFIAAVLWLLLIVPFRAEEMKPVEYDRDIRPILSENCFFCHGADANKRKGKLRLDELESAVAKKAIVPGKPEESEMIKRIFSSDPDEKMPPADSNRHLKEEQRELLRQWISEGAKYSQHWAFVPPVRPALPKIQDTSWPRNSIDYFVLARLEQEKLSPTERAPLPKLLRRVSLDLTGLPPTPEQMRRWQSEPNPYGSAVDELLGSLHFGERMASDWMDIARYADTHGFNNDSLRTMWRWRDWVIEAFNRNLPYNQFITEQLAGDLLPKPTLEQLVATGFNRNHVINSEGGIIDEEYRVEYVADRVQAASLAWLGLTMGCARCHDHKFDPVTQKDYYRFFAFFNNIDELGEDGRVANAAPFIPSPTTLQQEQISKNEQRLREAELEMEGLLKGNDWKSVQYTRSSLALTNQPLKIETNLVFGLNLFLNSASVLLSNAKDGKAVQREGEVCLVDGPFKTPALLFDGNSSLKTEALPNFDSGKGWAFSAWVRRDRAEGATLFSTMNFSVPASSQSYGEGVGILLTPSGSLDVRLARRWPAYSINVVSRDTLKVTEWQHVLITCDGSAQAKGVHTFINGRESFQDVLHDDYGSVSINGVAQIGKSTETNSIAFRGALAGIKLISHPPATSILAESAEEESIAAALEVNHRKTAQEGVLRERWLRIHNAQFAAASKAATEARNTVLRLQAEAPTTMVMHELKKPRPTFVLHRGQYDQPREQVEPGVPAFLLPFPKNAPRNRLGLAQWLTDRNQPLTPRVVVNRFWQSLFGDGIVKSVEDLGLQADWPANPQLLDWLAVEFVESGWDVKKLVRQIVTSATYCQDSKSTPELNARDPENRLLARGPRQRLTAEMLRDQALALSGLMQDELGGPPVFPYQPANLYKGIVVAADYPGTSYTESKGAGLYRRSLYSFWKRTIPNPTLSTFDAPDREFCVARRLRTNTPLQALALMNDPVQLEAAREYAHRILREGGESPAERIKYGFQLATSRAPNSDEVGKLSSLLAERIAFYEKDPEAAKSYLNVGASGIPEGCNPVQLAAYANLASLMLNLDETITRN